MVGGDQEEEWGEEDAASGSWVTSGEEGAVGRIQSDANTDPRVLLYRIEGREKQ